MKVTRDGIRDGVLIVGLGLTAAGTYLIWGLGPSLLVAGVVLLGAAIGGAVLEQLRGKPEP